MLRQSHHDRLELRWLEEALTGRGLGHPMRPNA
jgi:hypothetical protein